MKKKNVKGNNDGYDNDGVTSSSQEKLRAEEEEGEEEVQWRILIFGLVSELCNLERISPNCIPKQIVPFQCDKCCPHKKKKVLKKKKKKKKRKKKKFSGES